MHIFSEYVAMECGITSATILQHFSFWIEKNRIDERHFYDGRWWTYITVNGLNEYFFYLTPKQIRTAVDKLIEHGLVVTGNYNDDRRNRTRWYSITDRGYELLAMSKRANMGKTEVTKRANKDAQKGKSLNNNISFCNININTDKETYKETDKDILCISAGNACNPSTEELDEFFKSLWKLYPKKKGWGNVSRTQKLKLFRRGYDEISRCIERYKAFLEDAYSDAERDKFTKNGSTFFNSGYMDYLDENYNSQDTPVGDENSTDGLEPWERQDWQGGWVWVTSEDGLTERVFKPKPFNGEL